MYLLIFMYIFSLSGFSALKQPSLDYSLLSYFHVQKYTKTEVSLSMGLYCSLSDSLVPIITVIANTDLNRLMKKHT